MRKKKQRTEDKALAANSKTTVLGPGDTFTFDADSEDASAPAPAAVTEATSDRQATPTAEDSPAAPAEQEQSPDTPAEATSAAGDALAPATSEGDKAALSEDDLLASEFDDVEEDADAPDLTFSALDEADFRRLDNEVTKASRRTFTALREIRQRKLYRLPKDEQGNKLYPTFEAYVQQRHGHTRVWVTQGTNWLRIMEALEEVGVKVPLTVDAAQGLLPARLKDAGGLLAVLKEAKEDGVPFTKDNLRAVVERRSSYFKEGAKVAATTYADYKQDCVLVKPLEGGTWGIVTDARKLPGDLADNLMALCVERNSTPRAEQLLGVATGKALEEIVARLGTLAQRQGDIEAKKSRLKTLKAQVQAMLYEGSLTALRQEAKALETELVEEGVLKRKSKKPKNESQPGEGEPEQDQNDEEVEEEANEPQENLDNALVSVESALDCDWPDPEMRSLHEAILQSAQDCELKLAEVVAKAKERLADADSQQEEQARPHASGDFSEETLIEYEPEQVPEV
jgi:hypothetical protein